MNKEMFNTLQAYPVSQKQQDLINKINQHFRKKLPDYQMTLQEQRAMLKLNFDFTSSSYDSVKIREHN